MKLYSLLIFDSNYKLVHSKYNLDDFSFVFRYNIKKTIESFTNDLIHKTEQNTYYKITDKIGDYNFTIYGSTFNDFCIIITDNEYPQSTAFQLLNELKMKKHDSLSDNKVNSNSKNNLDVQKIDNMFVQYQDPLEVDKLLKLKNTVDEVKIILLDSLDKLIERDDELNSLIERSGKLETDSFRLRNRTKELNCCVLF